MWSTGEGNGKPLQYSCLDNPVNSRKNEGMEPKQKQYPAVDVTGDRSKVSDAVKSNIA